MTKSKIIKVQAHKCVDCGYLTEDKTKAEEHRNMPLVKLPVGLVLCYDAKYGREYQSEKCSIVNYESEMPVQLNHGFNYTLYEGLHCFEALKWEANAVDIISRINREELFVLTEEEFTCFIGFYSRARNGELCNYPPGRGFGYWNPYILLPDQLFRSTPELEKLLLDV
ncbi:hypothetical protein HYT51_00840, partial [Candidatus Woesearchaeota archaeon]|nr:hypothetical protein [Candidatus Woesearchaeota archaeon]